MPFIFPHFLSQDGDVDEDKNYLLLNQTFLGPWGTPLGVNMSIHNFSPQADVEYLFPACVNVFIFHWILV